MNKLLFVVGVGRSGTSLLQSMFASNPAVCYLPETSFIRRYLVTGRLGKVYATGGKKAVYEVLAGDDVFKRVGVNEVELIEGVDGEPRHYEKEIFCRLARVRCGDSLAWVGDKDPRLVEFLPLLPELASKVAVIQVIRDPRDVLLSKKKAAWSRNAHVWKHIFANRVQLGLGRQFGMDILQDEYHELIYEDLIAEPEKVLCSLCDAIGVPFDAKMLNFGEAARDLVANDEVSWKKETFGPLLATNKEKWKAGLSTREIALTELCCRQAFDIAGYQYSESYKNLSWLDRLWVLAGAAAIFMMDTPYRLYRKYMVKRACKQMG